MTWRHRLALPAALVVAACGGAAGQDINPHEWRAMLETGDGVGAEAALRDLLAQGAPRPEIAPFLGEAEMLQGDDREAESWLGAEDFAPDVAGHGYHMLGRLRMREGDLSEAGRAFDKALASSGDDPELWVDIGRLRYRGGEHAQALDAALRAMELGPRNPAALLFSAQLTRDAQGNRAALPLLERGLAVSPSDPDLLADYAATLGELGRANDMLVAVRKLAEGAPNDGRVLWLQAVLAARGGNTELARTLVERATEAARPTAAVTLLLAVSDLDNGNYESAAQALDRLSRSQPDNDRVTRLLARALALGGNDRELVSRFGDRTERPYYGALVARSFERLGERDKAAPILDALATKGTMRVMRLPARSMPSRAYADERSAGSDIVAFVRDALERGQTGEARSRAEAFVRRFPGSIDALTLAGDAALEAGDASAALAHYRAAASIRRQWPLIKRMVVALDRAGQAAAATALVADHLASVPANADAAVMLASRMTDLGNRDRARELVKRAHLLGRNDPLLNRLAPGS